MLCTKVFVAFCSHFAHTAQLPVVSKVEDETLWQPFVFSDGDEEEEEEEGQEEEREEDEGSCTFLTGGNLREEHEVKLNMTMRKGQSIHVEARAHTGSGALDAARCDIARKLFHTLAADGFSFHSQSSMTIQCVYEMDFSTETE